MTSNGVGPSSVAPAIAELAGGADRLAERARDFVTQGLPLQALHLLDIADGAEPGNMLAREVRIEALKQLLQQSGGHNLWERRWVAAEVQDLERRSA